MKDLLMSFYLPIWRKTAYIIPPPHTDVHIGIYIHVQLTLFLFLPFSALSLTSSLLFPFFFFAIHTQVLLYHVLR